MSIDFVTPVQEIPRDRWGRPLVVPPSGGKPQPYVRATTFVDCLEDKFTLQKWMQRMVALGLADRPDLLLAVSAHRDNKRRLDEICEAAREAVAASASATTGTALHALTEQYDRGTLDLSKVPAAARPDLDAYIDVTRDMRHVHIEQFMVHDGYKIGGTPDRLSEFEGEMTVVDVKTGNVDFGQLKIAMQLAVYSRSVLYDHARNERTGVQVNRARGIVIHLPAGEGKARLLDVDLNAGWEAVAVASAVRNWRNRSGLLSEITEASVPVPPAEIRPPSLLELIASTSSVESLTALWQLHAGEWTDVHTAAAAERKRQLAGAA